MTLFSEQCTQYQFPYEDESSEKVFGETSSFDELLRELDKLRMTGMCCDAVLATKDGAYIRVHKLVMSCCSEYFRVLFTTPLIQDASVVENSSRSFYLIPSISGTVLEMLINYAYSDKVDVNKDNVNELLPAADQFGVTGIVEECKKFVLKNMTVENCLGIWIFGKEYFMPELANEARRFIAENFEEVSLNTEEFLHLKWIFLKELLADNGLNVQNELFVWMALKRWCQHKYRKRHKNIPSLLPCVRMAFLFISDFKKVMCDPFIVKNVECRPYINMVSKYILDELKDISVDVLDSKALSIFTPRHPYEIILSSGGWTFSGVTNVLEAYDCRADLWKRLFSGGFFHRAYHQLAHMGDYIYVIGGSSGTNCLNSCWRLDLKSFSFEQICPMREKRCYLSAVILDDKIYAIGGFDGFDRLETVEHYDQVKNQWTHVSPMNEKRSDASASALRDRIFVVGGYDGDEFLQSAECYFAEFNQWLCLPPMNKCRSGVGCVAMGDAVYAIGGYDGKRRLSTVEKYSLLHRQWFATKPMKRPRSNFAVVVMEKKIYVMGGYEDENDTIVDEAEYFDPTHPRWHTIATMNVGRFGLSSCTYSGMRDPKPYIRDDRFRCLLKNVAREETIDLEDNHREN